MANDYISRDYAVENMESFQWDTEHDKNAAIHLVRELVPAADVQTVVHGDFCKEEGGDPVSKLYTVWLLPGEYATLMQALDTAIEHCAEYDITSLELAVIHLKESIKASTDFDNP